MKKSDFCKITNLLSYKRCLISYLIFSVFISVSYSAYSVVPSIELPYLIEKSKADLIAQQNTQDIKRINIRLQKYIAVDDTASALAIADSIRFFLGHGIRNDSLDLADACYNTGHFCLKYNRYNEAIFYFKKSIEIFEKTGRKSRKNYSNSLYNIGLTYFKLGDYVKSINFFNYSIENDKHIFGDNSVILVGAYYAISVNYILMRDYEKAFDNIDYALKIAQLNPDSLKATTLADLYGARGFAYSSSANYDQARTNLEKAESYYDKLKYNDVNYINILDNLGTVNHFLGSKEKSYYYYEKGLKMAGRNFTSNAIDLINNYAIILGNDHLEKRGEMLLSDFLKKSQQYYGNNSRNYYLILRNYADYLREFKINNNLALRSYMQCFNYIKDHPWDKYYRDDIILGYSLSLIQNGDFSVALDSIQTLLFPERSEEKGRDRLINPWPDSLKADGRSIKILNTKYQILWSEYGKYDNIKLLEAAAGTAELIIGVLERIRLNIGEEESRLLLGDRYRDSYMDAISCLNECYIKTNNQHFLEKAFEYSEKSKVASLLASTREMKAIQNHIPAVLANKEMELHRNIGFYNSKIAEEKNTEKPDRKKINLWNDIILSSSYQRDSIIKVFEKNYPDYFALKYSTKVISLGEVPGIIGKGNNYLSYIVSDSVLYIFISNTRYRQLISQKIDSSFLNIVSGFRKILITPDMDENSKNEFCKYQLCGHKLYSYLIEPIRKYLISGNLIISPDNILSYIPFETLIASGKISDDLIYRNLTYLMNDFMISYAYSATLLADYGKAKPSLRNRAIIFAPSYESLVNIDSISKERQATGGFLQALPNAKEEAEFVSRLTNGALYAGSSATESVYKKFAGGFDIIHLAMHTLINNQNPVFSKMIFYASDGNINHNGLNAFEVYGIRLKAKMVVLSSCNTGAGNLHKGEGILSLARGFIYSGSKSVVMSLWEVDDKSGTDIVKTFYRNLKNGNSKGKALRQAKLKYIKSAGAVRSHPHFWSTLVLYGDDSPLYYSAASKLIVLIIPVLLIIGVILYFKKR